MDDGIVDYIESHQDELREDYAEYLTDYGRRLVNAEMDTDEIKIVPFYEFAENSFTNFIASKEDDAYDAWKEQQWEKEND
jgi:hypothetical protein